MKKLIVIEGADGAGKETQTNLLIDKLKSKGIKVGTLSFPRYNETVGGKILRYSLGKEVYKPDFKYSELSPLSASLPYAMDRYESKSAIEDLLKNNDIVVLDRYFTANLLHQGAKFEDQDKRNEYIENISKIELDILKIPKPDIVIYLNLPYKISLSRMDKRVENQSVERDQVENDIEYVRNSVERGVSIANKCGWRLIECVVVSDGKVIELSREEINQSILDCLNDVI